MLSEISTITKESAFTSFWVQWLRCRPEPHPASSKTPFPKLLRHNSISSSSWVNLWYFIASSLLSQKSLYTKALRFWFWVQFLFPAIRTPFTKGITDSHSLQVILPSGFSEFLKLALLKFKLPELQWLHFKRRLNNSLLKWEDSFGLGKWGFFFYPEHFG